MTRKPKYDFSKQIQRNGQNLFQHVENYYGKIWRNMVPLAKYGSLLYTSPFYRVYLNK